MAAKNLKCLPIPRLHQTLQVSSGHSIASQISRNFEFYENLICARTRTLTKFFTANNRRLSTRASCWVLKWSLQLLRRVPVNRPLWADACFCTRYLHPFALQLFFYFEGFSSGYYLAQMDHLSIWVENDVFLSAISVWKRPLIYSKIWQITKTKNLLYLKRILLWLSQPKNGWNILPIHPVFTRLFACLYVVSKHDTKTTLKATYLRVECWCL